MINLSNVDAGYHEGHLATMTVTAVQGDRELFHRQALERVSALPGVVAAAFAWGVPLTGNSWPGAIEVEGQPPVVKASDRPTVPIRSVTPGYFDLLGLKIYQGRDFRASDKAKAQPVAVVNRAFVDRFFPSSSPIGKTVWGNGRKNPGAVIVGVTGDTRDADLTRAAQPEMYLCFWQAMAFSKDLVIRTASDPRPLIAGVQRALRSVDSTAAAENVRTFEQIRADSVASRAFAMRLLLGFSMAGCALSLVGIYGVLSLSIASRRREIAIRAAVGADQRAIRGLVLGEGLRLIAGGVVCGMVAALALSRALQSFLFQVEPADPESLIAAGLLFTAVALLACWAPGRRAAAVDPIEALRSE